MTEDSERNGSVSLNDVTKLKDGICRVCLGFKRPLVSLFTYRQSAGSYAEILTTFTNVQVSLYDQLSHKICDRCANFLLNVVKFKRVAEASDKKLHDKLNAQAKPTQSKKINFDSYTDVRKEMSCLNIKNDPDMKIEIEVLDPKAVPAKCDITGKDFLICNTVIRKVDQNTQSNVSKVSIPDSPKVSAPNIQRNLKDEPIDYDDDFGSIDFDNDSDDDYIPLAKCKSVKSKKTKPKFKKPKIPKLKNTKKQRVELDTPIKIVKQEQPSTEEKMDDDKPASYITCYPLLKNGTKGPPLILKRPKDSTILKSHPNYKPRTTYRKSNSNAISTKETHSLKIPINKNLKVKAGKNPNNLRPAIIKTREKLVCPICGILTYALGNHMATHAEKKRYTCPECNKSFAQKNNMLMHSKRHSGVKDHICEVCGAGFYSQKSLIRHNLIHKGERPFECNLCPKKFIARCDLLRHLRIHSGYKPFKCSDCSMSFNAKHQLQNHERMHTGEKPYTCEVCNVAFSYKVNLNNHVYKVHGINLKFKSIHTITEEILRKELELMAAPPPREMIDIEHEEKIQTSQSHVY